MGRLLRVMSLAAAAGVAGCITDVSGGPNGELTLYSLTVSVTNVGTGSGRVLVDFQEGATVQDPCPEVLGPGDSCDPRVVVEGPPGVVEVQVQAEAGSRFVSWTDANCSGDSTECTIAPPTGETTIEIALEPRFDLEPPAR